ncbi:DUF3566 domain-containing protein [Nesterenkonia sp. LB17]|uniref:DUF3566 domain-containing protein n=1 Tax=unclassified Nesterenkonia TaxID=2629769 RepID=UPI001F4CA9C6|nr:DUF3566 domain-containing protein [Nesterenkonia sp. DZ6]MCH8563478.1 DUF3566 domain-containing protein [Nesterenkonia sp. YGD6]MCH8566128.1 DUF3566 domain-containing protein [Nesterenkonia sp. LB17]MCH8570992.1 DUF3566 domain-containing protein [Nesterenkonia sp. AY15]
MSASNGAGNSGSQTGSSAARPANRFPAPRPRAQAAGGATTSPRPQAEKAGAPKPRPTAGARPSGQGARPAQGQRPTGSRPQPGLVRPTPKAKVRKARLLISKVDPWSVLKMSFLLSVALGIMTVVAAVTLWTVMDVSGIFNRVNELLGQILGTEGGGGSFRVEELVTITQVAAFATIIAVVNVVLLTVLSMLAAVLYNLSASLVGGVGVTLTDD